MKGALDELGNDGVDILGESLWTKQEPRGNSAGIILQVKVRGPAFMAQAVLPVISRGGRIINVSSRGAKNPQGDPYTFHAASKAALHSVTKSLAWQFAAPLGITVNTLMPGLTETGESSCLRCVSSKLIG